MIPNHNLNRIDQEEETKEIIENGDDNNAAVSARPRRMSEVADPPQPIIPIPEGSAFFFLSQGNRCGHKINRSMFDPINQTYTHIHTHNTKTFPPSDGSKKFDNIIYYLIHTTIRILVKCKVYR